MNVERSASEPPTQSGASGRASSVPGLAGLRAHLDRVVAHHHLRSLVVVVDDPDLGRQAFRAGAGTIEPGIVTAGPGVRTDPPLAPGALDTEMLLALCRMSLHLELIGEVEDDALDGELELRRLPGVYAVVIERSDDLTLCHVLATTAAPDDVGRRAAEALTASTGAKVVVEVRREALLAPAPASVGTEPRQDPDPAEHGLPESVRARFADATWKDDATRRRAERARPARPTRAPTPPRPATVRPTTLGRERSAPSLVAVRSVPAEGTIEAHLARGSDRVLGRAPLARGLAGASEAVLDGWHQLDPDTVGWTPAWVRTVETTADGRFVVAAALQGPDGDLSHGIATGSSPIDGAARATAVALADALISANAGSRDPRPGA